MMILTGMNHLHPTTIYIFILLSCLFACNSTGQHPPNNLYTERAATLDQDAVLTTIAFGSCNRQDAPQPMWDMIRANDPGLWIWLGDNIYGDTEDMQEMQAMYAEQKTNPDYQDFFQAVPVIGTWDDHDFGVNDGGREFVKKAESRDLMLDFLNVSADRPIREREGAYDAYTVGPEGRQVKVILLDTRYFRSPLTESAAEGRRYDPDPEGDMLGEVQWAWLENELRNSTAQLNIIASSIQVIPEQHGFEKWANFPNERERLFQLVRDTKAQGVVFLSGDRHLGEISRINMANLPYPVYDITSSGLTHSYEEAHEENRYREGELVSQKNFGLIEIDRQDTVRVRYSIRGTDNQVYQATEVAYP